MREIQLRPVSPARGLEQRERPGISTPQLSVRPSRGPQIVAALSQAVGAVAQFNAIQSKEKAEDQRERFNNTVNELEQIRTDYVQSQTQGDDLGARVAMERLLDISGKAASDESLSTQQRTELERLQQGFIKQNQSVINDYLDIQERQDSETLKKQGFQVATSVLDTMQEEDLAGKLVGMKHRGAELYTPAREQVTQMFAENAAVILGLDDPEVISSFIQEDEIQEQIDRTTRKVLGDTSRLYDQRAKETAEQNFRETQRNIINADDISSQNKAAILESRLGMDRDEAISAIKNQTVRQAQLSQPTNAEELMTTAFRVADNFIDVSETDRRETGGRIAETLINQNILTMDRQEFQVDGQDRIIGLANDYGFSVEISDDGEFSVDFSGETTNDVLSGFANEFEDLLERHESGTAFKTSTSESASDTFDGQNLNEFMLGAAERGSVAGRTHIEQGILNIVQKNPEEFLETQNFVGPPEPGRGLTLGFDLATLLDDWEADGFATDSDSGRRLASTLGAFQALSLDIFEARPDNLLGTLSSALENDNPMSAAWSLSILKSDDQLKRDFFRRAPADLEHAIDTMLGDNRNQTPVAGVDGEVLPLQDQIRNLRDQHANIQNRKRFFQNLPPDDPRSETQIAKRLRERIPTLPENIQFQDSFWDGFVLAQAEVERQGIDPSEEEFLDMTFEILKSQGYKFGLDHATNSLVMERTAGIFGVEEIDKLTETFQAMGDLVGTGVLEEAETRTVTTPPRFGSTLSNTREVTTRGEIRGRTDEDVKLVEHRSSIREMPLGITDYTTRVLKEDGGLSDKEAKRVARLMLGEAEGSTFSISQTREQRGNGGVTVSFTLEGTEGRAAPTRFTLTEKGIKALMLNRKVPEDTPSTRIGNSRNAQTGAIERGPGGFSLGEQFVLPRNRPEPDPVFYPANPNIAREFYKENK